MFHRIEDRCILRGNLISRVGAYYRKFQTAELQFQNRKDDNTRVGTGKMIGVVFLGKIDVPILSPTYFICS